MALRWKNFVPNTPLKAAEVNDLANNGCVQIDTATDLDDPNLVAANVCFEVATNTLHQRQAAGVGADKWKIAAAGGGSAVCTGGTETTYTGDGTNGDLGQNYKVHTFLASDTLTVNTAGFVDVLVVGGGGGGGFASAAGGVGGTGGSGVVIVRVRTT